MDVEANDGVSAVEQSSEARRGEAEWSVSDQGYAENDLLALWSQDWIRSCLDSYSCLSYSRLFRSLRLLWICYVLILSFLVINK
jgi:hypothetical protein